MGCLAVCERELLCEGLADQNVSSDARPLAVVVSDADAEPVVGATVFHWLVCMRGHRGRR